MINWKLRLWRSAGAAALIGGVGLAACGPGGTAKAPEQPAAANAGAETEQSAPLGATTGGGGESGEAGAASAFDGLAGDARTALRLAQLKGFLLIAVREADSSTPEAAPILIQQGLLEAYDPAAGEFGALNVGAVRAASDADETAAPAIKAKLAAAIAAIDAARLPLHYDHAETAARMTDIAAGIYQGVQGQGFVDPIEYQHSLGAALSARDVLADGASDLRNKNAAAYDEATAEIGRLIDLWPQTSAPENPTPYRAVLAQSARVRLALSPFLQ